MKIGRLKAGMEASASGLPSGYRKIPSRVNIAREVLDRPIERGLGEGTALLHKSGRLSYEVLGARVDSLARGFIREGVSRGTPVVLRMPNCPEFILSFLALLKIGALPVLLNSLLGQDEVNYVVEHSEAAAAVTLDPVAGSLREIRDRLSQGLIVARGAIDGDRAFEELTHEQDAVGLEAADTAADDPAFFVYTSGTTGRPKGICHAHRWIIALGDANKLRLPPLEDDVVMATGEWSFISALGHNVLFPLRNGMTGALLEGRALPTRCSTPSSVFGSRSCIPFRRCTGEFFPSTVSKKNTIYRASGAATRRESLYRTPRITNGSGGSVATSTSITACRKCRWFWGRVLDTPCGRGPSANRSPA